MRAGDPSGRLSIALEGAGDCVVYGRTYETGGLDAGAEVFIGVRPEDVEIEPADGAQVPPGMLAGRLETALFVGERIEYEVVVEGQGTVDIYGERHQPIEEGQKVWLKLRAEGHTAWRSDRAHDLEESL